MKEIELNKNSLWYRLAFKYGMLRSTSNLDTCTLKLGILFGLFHVAYLVALLGFLASVFTSAFIWLFVGFTIPFVQPGIMAVFGIGIIAAILTFLVIWAILNAIDEYSRYRRHKKYKQSRDLSHKPSVYKELFKSFKEKYCAKVVIK